MSDDSPLDYDRVLNRIVDGIEGMLPDPLQWSSDRVKTIIRAILVEVEEVVHISSHNAGCAIAANKLLDIAKTGRHGGTFGGESMEACAQEILKLHADHLRMEKLERGDSLCIERGTPITTRQLVLPEGDTLREQIDKAEFTNEVT
ncbi:hypothetical protein LCGC14_0164440 [marine sediment metagenome]|uniref:Uncharacterized protein n=1 Tax=marine sediment metagenome TaxID=412755 RepID=A0A0F9UUU7_9ZZZZ